MAAHTVVCKICNKKFDTNSVQAVRCGTTRYAHQTCFPEGELVPMEKDKDPSKTHLKDYIRDIYGDTANWQLIQRQISKFNSEGISCEKIELALKYFYEIEQNSIEGSKGGIGIVSYVLQKSEQYWFYQALLQNAEARNKKYDLKVREITIKPPKVKAKEIKLFDLGEGFNG